MEDTMNRKSFKDILASSGPDTIKTPMLSREERLTKFMPPAVAEMLEKRQMMTVTVGMNMTTLEITGTSGADQATVSVNTGDNSLYVSDGTTTYGPYWQGSISLIKMLMGDSADTVYIAHGGSDSVPLSCSIDGQGGTDWIEGGDLADSIYGGVGNDSLWAFGGNDKVYGDSDNDRVYGGTGADTMEGNNGLDTMYGDAGADSILGLADADSIYGGADNDTVDGGTEADFIRGEDGADSLLGGGGNDNVYGGNGNDEL
jgi:Ca2+-binding RTX toxin-like protein